MPKHAETEITGQDKALVDAAAEGDLDTMKKALRTGANVNVQAARGWTALHWTAVHGYKNLSQELLKAGADPNITTRNDKTPLDWAEGMGHQEMAKDLKKVTKKNFLDSGPYGGGEMG